MTHVTHYLFRDNNSCNFGVGFTGKREVLSGAISFSPELPLLFGIDVSVSAEAPLSVSLCLGKFSCHVQIMAVFYS